MASASGWCWPGPWWAAPAGRGRRADVDGRRHPAGAASSPSCDLSARHGIAFLVITHDLGVAGAVAEQVAVMRAGRIVESGQTADVFTAPAHPYTKSLLQATTTVGRL